MRSKQRLVFLPLIFTLTWLYASAGAASCECLWQGSFVDTQGEADLVVSGEIVQRKGNSMDLQIENRLRGTEYLESIRIWGEYDGTCRAQVDGFAPGTRWVMALQRIEEQPADGFNPATPNISFGREGDYALSRCGANWLSLHGNMVTGNLIDGPRWQWDIPDMSPVLLELVAGYIDGDVSKNTLKEAAAPQKDMKELLHDTRSFLRH